MPLPQLRRVRWAVRATLVLGVAASVVANVLHARDNPISQAIAAWPPLALLLTVELISRVPVHRRSLAAARLLATATIAGIAAWVSYWHMAGVVARYGETGTVPYLLPLSVDGLIVVASVSLVELSARRRDTTPASAPAKAPAVPTQASVAVGPAVSAVATATGAAPPQPGTGGAGPTAATVPPDQPAPDGPTDTGNDDRPPAKPAPGTEPRPDPDDEDDTTDPDDDSASDADDGDEDDDGTDLAADLEPLLPAARDARDELTREGRTVSRDALARRLRRNGTAIRNNRVSELLTALRREEPSVNGSRPKLPV